MRKYVSQTLSASEQSKVDDFLAIHPEMKNALDGMTLNDLNDVANISSNVNAKTKVNQSSRLISYAGIAALILVLIGTVWFASLQNKENAEVIVVQEDNGPKKLADTIHKQSKPEEKLAVVEIVEEVDTFYTVEKKGDSFKFDVESTAKVNAIVEENHTKDVKVNQVVEVNEKMPKPEIVEKNFNYSVSLEYRQSVEVESNFANAHKVGGTMSYAGPIAGYQYEESGMPIFKTGDEVFYHYLESELSKDPSLEGIAKKMQARVSFEVNNKGKVNDVKIINCNHKQLCMSLSNIFETIPDWNPSEHKGKKGRVHYVIEVVYSK